LIGEIKSLGLIDFSFFNVTIKNKEKEAEKIPTVVIQQ
jgi:hypothetical protein